MKENNINVCLRKCLPMFLKVLCLFTNLYIVIINLTNKNSTNETKIISVIEKKTISVILPITSERIG